MLKICFLAQKMANEKEKWHWQEPGSAWKGVGIYHVTMVIPNRKPLLGRLVIPENDPMQARVELTPFGNKIKECMRTIPEYHPEVRIIGLRMMPDHVHIILYVTRTMKVGIKTVVRGFWQGVKKIGRAYAASILPNDIRENERCNESPNNIQGNERCNESPNNIRGNERCNESPNNIRGNEGCLEDAVFTEFPFIRVMSRRGQLKAMIRYVQMNPQRLATKRLHPGFFRVQRGVEIAGRTYDAVGNIAILLENQRATVHVRRKMVEAAERGEDKPLRDYMNGCVAAARAGAVMVSPFISPKEKEVLMVLIEEKHQVIYLSDNGFGEFFKPSDTLFESVAAGRMLILSPHSFDADKRRISRGECVLLNNLAEEIAEEN